MNFRFCWFSSREIKTVIKLNLDRALVLTVSFVLNFQLDVHLSLIVVWYCALKISTKKTVFFSVQNILKSNERNDTHVHATASRRRMKCKVK